VVAALAAANTFCKRSVPVMRAAFAVIVKAGDCLGAQQKEELHEIVTQSLDAHRDQELTETAKHALRHAAAQDQEKALQPVAMRDREQAASALMASSDSGGSSGSSSSSSSTSSSSSSSSSEEEDDTDSMGEPHDQEKEI
jgi:hypothetical protein